MPSREYYKASGSVASMQHGLTCSLHLHLHLQASSAAHMCTPCSCLTMPPTHVLRWHRGHTRHPQVQRHMPCTSLLMQRCQIMRQPAWLAHHASACCRTQRRLLLCDMPACHYLCTTLLEKAYAGTDPAADACNDPANTGRHAFLYPRSSDHMPTAGPKPHSPAPCQ
jgi:hypothetical protein